MRIVLDTTVWFSRPALAALRDLPGAEVVVPSIVFTERARQFSRDGRRTPSDFLDEIRANGWSVEAYDVPEAMRHAVGVADDRQWRRLARDAMIAGHVGEGDRLWTANVADFLAIGVPRERIRDINALAPGRPRG